MLRQFIKDSSTYSFSNLLVRGISVLLVPFYTRVFTPSDYGIIDLLAILGAIVSMVFPLQISQGVSRFFPDTKKKEVAISYSSTALIFTIISYSIFVLISFTFSEIIAKYVLGDVSLIKILRIASLGIFTNGLFYFVQNQLRWMLMPKKQAITSFITSLFTINFTIIFVLVFKIGVYGVFWAQVIGGLIGFLIGYYYSRVSYNWKFDLKKFKEMLSYCLPLVPSGISIFIMTYIDRITINKMMTLQDLGLYGVGYRVSSIVTLLMMGFQGAITPLIFTRYKEPSTPLEIARIFRYFVFGALIMLLSISIFSAEILKLITTPAYYPASIIIPFLLISTFLSGMYVFAPGIDIAKKTKYSAIIFTFGAGINLSVNLFLIPVIGILGTSISAMTSSMCVFTLMMLFSQKYYTVPHKFGRLILSCIFTFIMIYAGFNLEISSKIILICAKFGIILTLLLLLIYLKIISFEEVKHYLSLINIKYKKKFKLNKI